MTIKIKGFEKPVAVLSTTVLPIDGTYTVETVNVSDISISGVHHYIGHPTTRAIVERLGAIPAPSKLFKGLEPREIAVCFSIKQGMSNRAKDGFTNPHQEVTTDDLVCRVIQRIDWPKPCPFCGTKGHVTDSCCPGCGAT
jgi:hypothetical protein